jgi:RNA polymerase sigma-70 factor (ECF subfamily)
MPSGFRFLKLFSGTARLIDRNEENSLKLPLEDTAKEIDIALLKHGESRVFARFVRGYQDMVFVCCRTVGLRNEDIEDAASETFLAAYKSIKNYNGKSKLSSWLWKIAYHKAIDYRRKHYGREVCDENHLEIPAAGNADSPGMKLESEE